MSAAQIDEGALVETFAGELVPVDAAGILPAPIVWPVCDVCHVPYALKLPLFVFNGPRAWLWVRDCEKPRSTCKGAGVELHDAAGAVPQEGRVDGR